MIIISKINSHKVIATIKYSFEYLFKVTKINLFSLRLTHKLARPILPWSLIWPRRGWGLAGPLFGMQNSERQYKVPQRAPNQCQEPVWTQWVIIDEFNKTLKATPKAKLYFMPLYFRMNKDKKGTAKHWNVPLPGFFSKKTCVLSLTCSCG